MKKIVFLLSIVIGCLSINAKTLIVYYSYTNNVEKIVNQLSHQIETDVVEIDPAEKGLDYAANNYAIGSAQIGAIKNNPDDSSSYPAIDSVDVNLDEYDTIIIAAPLWWSQMAAPLQTYLFHNGNAMAGKNIGLIVSSASSGISGVEADAKRLIPYGHFLSPSLWIRSSQTSNASSMLENWLKEINYDDVTTGIERISNDSDADFTVYNLSGQQLMYKSKSIESLHAGIYIINGNKTYITQ
ncbi:MAG: flavodoxin [Bacteroidales bacterium]|nr:flavodoxin [Bacteroidales bacterium]MBD5190290.1 flavodoxin [Bacteroidales bacterium]MBD5208503.1 flavodoxin [Bacteroidales bacterium]